MNELKELGNLISKCKTDLNIQALNIKKLQCEYADLVNKPEHPEYPNGTFGMFNDASGGGVYGYLKNEDHNSPYQMHDVPTLDDPDFERWKHFTPLTEAILPMPVENTGTCPWNDGDEVRVEFENDTFETDHNPHGWTWDKLRGSQIVRTWLIKAAK